MQQDWPWRRTVPFFLSAGVVLVLGAQAALLWNPDEEPCCDHQPLVRYRLPSFREDSSEYVIEMKWVWGRWETVAFSSESDVRRDYETCREHILLAIFGLLLPSVLYLILFGFSEAQALRWGISIFIVGAALSILLVALQVSRLWNNTYLGLIMVLVNGFQLGVLVLGRRHASGVECSTRSSRSAHLSPSASRCRYQRL